MAYGRCQECGGHLACRRLGVVEERVEEPFCYVIDKIYALRLMLEFWSRLSCL